MTATTPSIAPDWQIGPIRLWKRPHQPGDRGEPGARDILSQALGQPPHTLPITRDERGRPHFIDPLRHLETGWSHGGDVLLVALGENVELGVDVERVRARPRAMEVARRFFHADEVDWLLAQPEAAREQPFFRLWCAKEAVLKAHGQGISFGLHRLVFTESGGRLRLDRCDPQLGSPADWTLDHWSPAPGYLAALAWYPRRPGPIGDTSPP